MTLVTVPSSDKFPVQFKGSAFARKVLQLFGWQYVFSGLPCQQGVIIGYPHTSNWDFVVGILIKAAIGIQVQFWAKHSLFRVPLLGPWVRSLGGVAVKRHAPGDLVDQTATAMLEAKHHHKWYWLALAPEGTRAYQDGWRSGFYRVAQQADVPLGIATLDYARKTMRLQYFIRLSHDTDHDYQRINAIVSGVVGYHADQASPVRPLASPTRTQETT